MEPRRVVAVALRLAQQFRRDRRTLALIFVAPLVILTLLWGLVRHQQTPGQLTFSVVNQDRGPLAAQVIATMRRAQPLRSLPADSTPQRSEARLKSGASSGYVVFPTDFTAVATNQHRFNEQERLDGGDLSAQPVLTHLVDQALFDTALRQQLKAVTFPSDRPRVSYLRGPFDALDVLGAAAIGVVVFFLVFIVTSVVFLRERTGGTLERLMASPISRGELVLGYMVGLGALTLVQGLVVLGYSLAVLHIHNQGNIALVLLFTGLIGLGAANLGIFVSVFSRTEFQAVQFVPLVVAPQLFLAGLIFPVDSEPLPLWLISNILPLTYGIRGLREVMLKGAGIASGEVIRDLLVLLLFAVLALVAAGKSLRRRVA
ncbi:MAG: ABC transporter permease [Candidatus Dormibacteria bacterium]